jgi:hypothetical protein
MRRSRMVALSLVLAGVGVGCYKFIGFPNYGRPIVIAVVIQKSEKGTCTTHTSPQWQPVRQGEDFIWDVVAGDKCADPSEVTIQFEKSDAVRITPSKKNPHQIGGHAAGVCGRYKYSVLIKNRTTEDPEIEIWP